MCKLYIVGLGCGKAKTFSEVLDKYCFSPELRTCIFHAAPFYLQELAREKGFHLKNLQEEIETKPGSSLNEIREQTTQYILKIL